LVRESYSYILSNKKLGAYDWRNQIVQEVSNLIHENFSNLEQAFSYFCCHPPSDKISQDINHMTFEYRDFVEGLNKLFPTRYNKNEIQMLWDVGAKKSTKMTFDLFKEFCNSTEQSCKPSIKRELR